MRTTDVNMQRKALAPTIVLLGASALLHVSAAPTPGAGEDGGHHGFITVGQEFAVNNISGTEVKATVIITNEQAFICSHYHHGWTTEGRRYSITNSFTGIFIRGCAINVLFSLSPTNTFSVGPKRSVGAVYVVNNHGEVVKVDDITNVDLTW